MESGKVGTTGESRKTPILSPVAPNKSCAATVNVSATNIAIQTDLTWPTAEDKVKKVSDFEKSPKRQAAEAAKNQEAKSTQLYLNSRNPSYHLSGEPGSSKTKTGKDT